MGGSVIIRKDLNVPITLQSLLVLLPAIWFGWRVGLITVILYILAGGFGLPVFCGREFRMGKDNQSGVGWFFSGVSFFLLSLLDI
jgi:biotin transporter BioY